MTFSILLTGRSILWESKMPAWMYLSIVVFVTVVSIAVTRMYETDIALIFEIGEGNFNFPLLILNVLVIFLVIRTLDALIKWNNKTEGD